MELLIIIPVIIAFIVLIVGTLWGFGTLRKPARRGKHSKGDDHTVDDSGSSDSGDGGGGDAGI